jgi:uncharacterized protein
VAVLNLRHTLSAVRHVDHHAHSILRSRPVDVDAFRGLFSESADPRQWPHVATTVTYQRAIELLASELGCEPREQAVFERRQSTDPSRYASELLAAAGAEALLLDEGYPPAAEALSSTEMAQLAGCPVRPVLRLEMLEHGEDGRLSSASRERVAGARDAGYAALKTIVAYRGGLDLEAVAGATRDRLTAALEINRDAGDPLPVQIHTGFGDSELLLPRTDPSHLKPVFERFAETDFVLLHCYPFIRQAGWLASVYANVFIDLSLTIPHVSRPAAALAEAVELAPLSKLLYASDAVRTPELYLLAARWWRDALAEVLAALLSERNAQRGAELVLRENALALYRL